MAWQSYVYQYGVMLVLFLVGLVLAWRQGEVGFGGKRQRRNLLLLVGGMVFFMLLQGALQFGAPPRPVQAPGTIQDRFFVRTFEPVGEPREVDGMWKLRMVVEGAWYFGPTGQKETAYRLEQEVDSGEPGRRFQKICPIFGGPVTDWHPDELEPFVERGYRFSEAKEEDCLPACERFEPEGVGECQAACVRRCASHRVLLFRGRAH